MGIVTIVLPDVGEGIAEAEVTEWQVKPGDIVKEDDVLAVVMTDKAAVEVPSSMDGKVTWVAGEVGDIIAIGAPLVKLESDAQGAVVDDVVYKVEDIKKQPETKVVKVEPKVKNSPKMEKPLAAPSVRKRAMDAGTDLREIIGTGPAGRITHDDLDQFIAQGAIAHGPVVRGQNTGVKQIKITGMRRKIAEKMALSKARIPHITIVEEVDMTNLEDLREQLNVKHKDSRAKLTILPFMMRAIAEAVREQPEMNALYDDETGVVAQHGGVHIGIAAQTPNGLTVPVAKHAEAMSLWDSAQEIARLAELAKSGKATRDDLTGSTITITSLGPLGALATTPIINHPEVVIVGINKMAIRPMWDGQQFQPRKMMNISCSFDHRIIDGWDAATFVKKLKTLLESPAMLFVEG
jgi:2-oxoisovalerate dehydrogenase E2 component (dihydrolipoyl transacylase)